MPGDGLLIGRDDHLFDEAALIEAVFADVQPLHPRMPQRKARDQCQRCARPDEQIDRKQDVVGAEQVAATLTKKQRAALEAIATA